MKRNLFNNRKRNSIAIYVFIVLLFCLFLFRTNLLQLYEENIWFWSKNITTKSIDKQIDVLKLENLLLRGELDALRSGSFWHDRSLFSSKIINVVWKNQERLFLIADDCESCVVINANGLVGLVDDGFVKPITYNDSFLVVKSFDDNRTYLLKSNGYNKYMSVLESDLADYPPVVGESLFTSGLDDIYPANLFVCKVLQKNGSYFCDAGFTFKLKPEIFLIRKNVKK